MRTVELIHEYQTPARDVWDIATDYACLSEVMEGLVTFEGLPEGRVIEGQVITVMVSLFGKLAAQPYHMEITRCDDGMMVLISSERGAGVKSWKHRVQVEATATGSRLSDRIEIDAGWLSGAFALWAKFMYGKRHFPRLRILERRAAAAKLP